MAERPLPGTSPDALVTQAIGHLERTLSDGRPDPAVELALGAMYVQSKQFDKAITTLRTFLVSQPGYPEAMMLLAEAYEGAGRIADTVRQLEDVIREDPDQLRARAWLADLFERAGRWSEAATAWGDLVKLGPRARSYRARYATALVNAGDVDAGRRELVAITRETPRDLSAWYLLAQVEQQSGNAEGAEAAAKRIAEIDPEDARAALALSGARVGPGRFSRRGGGARSACLRRARGRSDQRHLRAHGVEPRRGASARRKRRRRGHRARNGPAAGPGRYRTRVRAGGGLRSQQPAGQRRAHVPIDSREESAACRRPQLSRLHAGRTRPESGRSRDADPARAGHRCRQPVVSGQPRLGLLQARQLRRRARPLERAAAALPAELGRFRITSATSTCR